MTNRIDRFIEAMFRKSADTLVFGTGTPVRLRTGNKERVILDRKVRTEQIIKLLQPIAGQKSGRLDSEGETCFAYESPSGRVQVTATTRGERMMAVVLPAPKPGIDDVLDPRREPMAINLDDDEPFDVMGNMAESAVELANEAQRSMEAYATAEASETAQSGAEEPGSISLALESPSEAARSEPVRSAPIRGAPIRGEPIRGEPLPKEPASDEAVELIDPVDMVSGASAESEPVREPPSASSPPVPATGTEAAINTVLRDLVKHGGSDLHLTSGQRPRIRKDGDIAPLAQWNDELTSEQIDEWMAEVAHEKAQEVFRENHDSDFAHEIDGVARFRMNWFRDRNGVGAVMRTIPSKVLTADQLNLPDSIRNLCTLPKGLVVVTGPTGSGKSTTLAAMIDLINTKRADHIITIEDPVEFVHQSRMCLVNQREVHTHTKSFSAALRAALREDPDIVLVGEMRDLETVHIAIETAETGHLVFGTLHTNTAASTVDRIIDQFPTDHQAQIRVMLSESLKGVVAQTLCKKKGGGRVACMEILIVNNAISNLIREGKTFQIPSIMQTNRGIGMQTQTDHMLRLVQGDVVDPNEAVRKAVDPPLMKQTLERNGFKLEA